MQTTDALIEHIMLHFPDEAHYEAACTLEGGRWVPAIEEAGTMWIQEVQNVIDAAMAALTGQRVPIRIVLREIMRVVPEIACQQIAEPLIIILGEERATDA